MQTPKEVAQILRALADTLDRQGYPQAPFIVQGHPQDPYGLFLVLWRPMSQDRDTTGLGLHEKPGPDSRP